VEEAGGVHLVALLRRHREPWGLAHMGLLARVDLDSIVPTAYEGFAGFGHIFNGRTMFNRFCIHI
jgi:hypothetical protein